MRQSRNSDAWLSINISPRIRTVLLTTRPVDEEVFASLGYLSEVRDAGLDYIKGFGHSNSKEVFLLFQSFIRQAKTFYESASHLKFRASALIYYYSFLKLAKAYICLLDPAFVSSRVTHGLRFAYKPGKLSSQFVINENSGVFNKFYQLVTGQKIPPKTKINIARVLGYCTDIVHEYTNAGYGKQRVAPASIRLLSNMRQKISWPILAVQNFGTLSPYKKSLINFGNYYEQVEPDRYAVREAFEIYTESLSNYSFFESKKTYAWEVGDLTPVGLMKKDCFTVLQNLYETNVYNEKEEMFLNAPLRKNLQIPFCQMLAIYTAMFYLGSLVRYRPDYLEKLLDSKDAWIVERFTYSAPSTFLRSISNLILQKDYVYTAR